MYSYMQIATHVGEGQAHAPVDVVAHENGVAEAHVTVGAQQVGHGLAAMLAQLAAVPLREVASENSLRR